MRPSCRPQGALSELQYLLTIIRSRLSPGLTTRYKELLVQLMLQIMILRASQRSKCLNRKHRVSHCGGQEDTAYTIKTYGCRPGEYLK